MQAALRPVENCAAGRSEHTGSSTGIGSRIRRALTSSPRSSHLSKPSFSFETAAYYGQANRAGCADPGVRLTTFLVR